MNICWEEETKLRFGLEPVAQAHIRPIPKPRKLSWEAGVSFPAFSALNIEYSDGGLTPPLQFWERTRINRNCYNCGPPWWGGASHYSVSPSSVSYHLLDKRPASSLQVSQPDTVIWSWLRYGFLQCPGSGSLIGLKSNVKTWWTKYLLPDSRV